MSDDDLLEEFHKVVLKINNIPTWNVFKKYGNISPDTIRKRLGGTQGTLRQYKIWLEKNFPDSPLLEKINIKSKHEIPSPVEENLDIGYSSKSGILKEWNKDKYTNTAVLTVPRFEGVQRNAEVTERLM